MADGIWSAASGATIQLRQLDVTANNVANASTPGFRRDALAFREVLGRANGVDPIRLSRVDRMVSDPTPGELIPTGRPMDVSLRTPGYLSVLTEDGERYTRVGSLSLSADGFLRTKEGHPVLSIDRKPVRVLAGTRESEVGVDDGGGISVKGVRVAELLVVGFADERGLDKTGGALFSATEQSGRPSAVNAEFESGSLEGSNVSAVEGMVDIVNATRSFEACQRLIDAFRDVGRRASSIMTPR